MSVWFSNAYGPFVLAGILLFLLLLWFAFRRALIPSLEGWVGKHKGTKGGATVGCVLAIAMGAYPTYQVVNGLIYGEQFCAFRHCNKTLFLSPNPDMFWASFIAWLIWAVLFNAFGLFGFYRLFVKKRYVP